MILAFGQLCLSLFQISKPLHVESFPSTHWSSLYSFTYKKTRFDRFRTVHGKLQKHYRSYFKFKRRSKLTPCHRKEQITFSITRILMYSICIKRNEQFYVHISLDPKDQQHNWTSKHVGFCNLRKRKPSN